jgi:hypothetical protein
MEMSAEMREALEAVAVRILEDAAFLFTEDATDAQARFGTDWIPTGAQLRWVGPSRGAMRLWADPSLLPVLAANMLGIDETDPAASDKGSDALREILNMVVGNCLTEAWGPGPIFKLDIPSDADPAGFSTDVEDGFWIVAEGRPVVFWCGGEES